MSVVVSAPWFAINKDAMLVGVVGPVMVAMAAKTVKTRRRWLIGPSKCKRPGSSMVQASPN